LVEHEKKEVTGKETGVVTRIIQERNLTVSGAEGYGMYSFGSET
jgi:hypothetical protein